MMDSGRSLRLVCLMIGGVLIAAQWAGASEVYYTDGERILVAVVHSNGQLSNCQLFDSGELSNDILQDSIFLVGQEEFDSLLQSCNNTNLDSPTPTRKKRNVLFVEGTKWCGPGDIAANYSDLGTAVATDTCCRDHDNCDRKIPGFSTAYGITNIRPFTVVDCECEQTFFDCLKEANTTTSNQVGELFFNVLSLKCISDEHPLTCNGFWFWRKCEPDLTKPKEPTLIEFDKKF